MKLLCLTDLFPLPMVTGTHVRVTGLLRSLAGAHQVHLLCRADETVDIGRVAQLRAELGGAAVEVFDPGPAPGRTFGAKVARWSVALRAGRPTWVGAQHHPGLLARAEALVAGADAIVILDDYAGSYVKVLAAVPGRPAIVVDKSNVMGASLDDAADAADVADGVRRLAVVVDRRLVKRHERGYIALADAVVVTSADEASRMHRLYGRWPNAVVTSATTLLDVPDTPRAGPPGILYVGNLAYGPNAEGLNRFVDEGWGTLAARGARLLVAGVVSPSQAARLRRHAGVVVLGFVDDLASVCASATLAVAPVWKGAGVKVKSLTMLGAGLPLVATPVALEGIAAEHGRHVLVGETPADLAGAITALLDDAEQRARLGAEGRRLVADRYTWSTVGQEFVGVVERAVVARRSGDRGRRGAAAG